MRTRLSAFVLWLPLVVPLAGCEKGQPPRAASPAGAQFSEQAPQEVPLEIIFDGTVAFVPTGWHPAHDGADQVTALLVDDHDRGKAAPVVQKFLTYVDQEKHCRVPPHVVALRISVGIPCAGATGDCGPTGDEWHPNAMGPWMALRDNKIRITDASGQMTLESGSAVSFPDKLKGIHQLGQISPDCFPRNDPGCAAVALTFKRGKLQASGGCERVAFDYFDQNYTEYRDNGVHPESIYDSATWTGKFPGTEIVVHLDRANGDSGPAFRIRPDEGKIAIMLLDMPQYDIDNVGDPYPADQLRAYHFALFYSLDKVLRGAKVTDNYQLDFPIKTNDCPSALAGGKPYCSVVVYNP
jgi:hypothetical protein